MTTATPNVPGWDLPGSPFHPGELAIQDRVGVRAKMDVQGRRAVRRFMTEQQRTFFRQLPYFFIGSVDADGQPWASMVLGEPGFLTDVDDVNLRVAARPLWGDPLRDTLREGAPLAGLGVELPTRRRNRVIGTARNVGEQGFTIAVQTTMGVCPQYIQGRMLTFSRDPLDPEPRPVHDGATLDEAARAIIARADTFFVASVDPRHDDGVTGGADISHRGGRPGFVRIDDEATLTTPDFVGNFIFNTLGNFEFEPRAGLMFVDFASGDMLYLAVTAEVIWHGPEVAAFAGAQRLVRYRINRVIRVERSLPAAFSEPDVSPLIAQTGSWEDVARTIDAERRFSEWRPFKVASVTDESRVVRSFVLEPADGEGVAGYIPGQFLPIRVTTGVGPAPVTRTYTLSDAPNGRSYRISVKREGRGGVSDWLHDAAETGATIEALAPRGSFTFDFEAKRPAVLISAGIGITPMIAMMNSLLVNNGRTRHHAALHFIHAALNSDTHAFADHLRDKASKHSNLSTHIRYSNPLPTDAIGTTHDSEGFVDIALLKSLLPLDDYDFYLCGPPGFMQTLYDGLVGIGVRNERIHFESFGPASVKRVVADAADTSEAVIVTFAKSGKTARWRPSSGSLLDLAEQAGVAPLSSCRSGVCGTCATSVLEGSVDYAETPAHDIASGEALICCATPHAGPHLDNGSLDREGITLDL